MALPSFGKQIQQNNLPQQKKEEVYKQEYTQEEINRSKSTKALIKKKSETLRVGTIEEIKCIDLEVLRLAPYWFFDKYVEIVKKIVEITQRNISANGSQSALISQVKNDPTNIELKTKAFYFINQEFLNFDNNNRTIEYSKFDEIDKKIILTSVFNEICGLDVLEPLMQDTTISEVICNGPFDVQVDINGKIMKIESCKFRDANHLNDLIVKLLSSINKEFTRKVRKVVGRLKDQSRVTAIHQIIAPAGPSLNIRRHHQDWFSPDDLLKNKTVSLQCLEWIGSHINAGLNILVAGATSSGKTTLFSALTGFCPNDERMLIVEENLEMKPCPTKLWGTPMEVVQPMGDDPGTTMLELVEMTTQMRPAGIFVGEVKDKAAWALLNALNTGHFGGSTIHSNSAQDSVNRLVMLASQAELAKGEIIYELIASAFDLVIFVERDKEDGHRRILEVAEFGRYPIIENGRMILPVKPIWKFIPDPNAKYIVKGDRKNGEWKKVGDLSQERVNDRGLNFIKLKNWNELTTLYKGV